MIFLVLLTFASHAQWDINLHELDNLHKEKLGDKLMKEGSYYNAIDYYKEIIKTDTSRHDIEWKIAESYFWSRDYKDAEPHYAAYFNDNESAKTQVRFNYAETLRHNKNYQEARKQYTLFRRGKYLGADEKIQKKIAAKHLRSCVWAMAQEDKPNFVYQVNLGDSINSGYTDFSPMVLNDTALIFASLRSDTILHVHPGTPEFFPVHLYQAAILDEEDWGDPQLVETVINKDFEHTANPTVTEDKQIMIFTYCQPHHSEVRCHLYRRDWLETDDTWSRAYKLHHQINRPHFTSTMPTTGFYFKGRGKRRRKVPVLYFVSNRKGGRGGLDIWYSEQNKRDKYIRPRNAGKRINTLGDEITPFYNQEEHFLYFSSNFHANMGGFDMFKTKGHTKKWQSIQNLGYGLNTSMDDTYYTTNADGTKGYYVSNRPGGHVLMSETCCDDIYYYNKLKQPEIQLYGFVLNKFDKEKKPLNHEEVDLWVKRPKLSDTLLHTASIQDSLDLDYNWIISPNNEYYIVARKEGFESDTSVFSTYQLQLIDTIHMDVLVQEPGDSIAPPDTTELIAQLTSEDEKEVVEVFTKMSSESSKEIIDTIVEAPLKVEKQPEEEMKITYLKSESSKEIVEIKYITDDFANLVKGLVVDEEETIDIAVALADSTDKFPYKRGEIIQIVYHGFDKDPHTNKEGATIDFVLALMRKFKTTQLTIESHTDSKGKLAYNDALSARRAKSVKAYMVKKGIASSRIFTKSFGERKPAAPNTLSNGKDNPKGRALNRRTEFRVKDF